jgi:hypothetical protein
MENKNENGESDVLVDINRYLKMHSDNESNEKRLGKSISAMLRVLFKGKIMSEAEWVQNIEEVINRRAI